MRVTPAGNRAIEILQERRSLVAQSRRHYRVRYLGSTSWAIILIAKPKATVSESQFRKTWVRNPQASGKWQWCIGSGAHVT